MKTDLEQHEQAEVKEKGKEYKQPEAFNILDEKIKVLKKNKELKYSDDRMAIIEDLDFNQELIEYLSSEYHSNSQIKKKKDFLAEDTPLGRKLDTIAYYILFPEFRNEEHEKAFKEDETGRVLNNIGENNIAYKHDHRMKEEERVYGYPTMSLFAMNRNQSKSKAKKEVLALDMTRLLFGQGNQLSQDSAFEKLEPVSNHSDYSIEYESYERLIHAFTIPSNVITYLKHEQELLYEVRSEPSSEYHLLSHIFEDIIEELRFKEIDMLIIKSLKDGTTYEDIANTEGIKMSERQVRRRIKSISTQIADKITEDLLKYS